MQVDLGKWGLPHDSKGLEMFTNDVIKDYLNYIKQDENSRELSVDMNLDCVFAMSVDDRDPWEDGQFKIKVGLDELMSDLVRFISEPEDISKRVELKSILEKTIKSLECLDTELNNG
jgi:hypothetical protein